MLRTADKRLHLGPLPDVLRAFRPTVYDDEGHNNSNGTLITAPAGANSKGNWQQITASCPIDADGFYIQALVGQGTKDLLFDVGIGGAGSEVAILENVLISSPSVGAGDGYSPGHFYVPLPVTAGTRVAGRYQTSSTTNDELFLLLQFVKDDRLRALRCSRATTYGANTADSGGTSVDPGGSVNTKGGWSELSSAITNPIRHAIVCIGSQANGTRTNYSWAADIGIGAALSESVVIPNMYLRARLFDDVLLPHFIERSVTIRAGQRLAARAQANGTDATDRLFDAVVIGFD